MKEGTVKFNIDTDDPPIAKDGTKKSWQEYYFGGVPVIAAITEMTKFQNDVRNAQSEVTNHLFKQIGAEDIKFDNLMPIVSSNTPAVFSGQKYQAQIYLGAYSSTQQFQATANGKPLTVESGIAKYEAVATGMGPQKVKVNITYKDSKGNPVTLPIETEYQVFTGSATISAEKMNVLYIGLDNPIAVSVPGFRPEQVIANASSGVRWSSVPGKPGHYVAKPDGSQREVTVSVSVKMADNTTKMMGSMLYRIRPVPNPEVMFGTKTGGAVSRGELATVSFVTAGLGPGFAFDGLKYDVTGYTLYFVPKVGGQPYIETVVGNRVSQGAKAKFAQARPGDMIVITEVNATGPTGRKVLNGPAMPVR